MTSAQVTGRQPGSLPCRTKSQDGVCSKRQKYSWMSGAVNGCHGNHPCLMNRKELKMLDKCQGPGWICLGANLFVLGRAAQ